MKSQKNDKNLSSWDLQKYSLSLSWNLNSPRQRDSFAVGLWGFGISSTLDNHFFTSGLKSVLFLIYSKHLIKQFTPQCLLFLDAAV